jgi:glycosyltransferase involved in cell wall biosynthesis
MRILIWIIIFFEHKIFCQFFKPSIAIVGYILESDGLGKITYSMHDSLKNNFNVSFLSSRDGITAPSHIEIGTYDKYYDIVIFCDAISYKNQFFAKNIPDGKLKIAYSMFESSEIPFEWVNFINKKIDVVIVPNQYLCEVYKKSGIQKKILLLEPGIKNIEEFLSYNKLKRKNKNFTFTYSSLFLDRKNHLNLLKSFYEAFGNNNNFNLILHGRGGDKCYIKKIKKFISENKIINVKLIAKNLNRDEYVKLIAESDCYVAISKGEGFSISPRESLAAGVPTIVSNNTAQKTLCKSNKYIKIESKTIQESDYKIFFGRNIGHCFDVDIQDLAKKLKEVYLNYDYYFNRAQLDRYWIEFYREIRFFKDLNNLLMNLIN